MAARMLTQSWTAIAAAIGAGDVMGGALPIANFGEPGKVVRILSSDLMVDHTAIVSGETSYALALYNVTPPSDLADNDPWDIPAGDRASFLGRFSLGTPADIGSSLYIQTPLLNIDLKMGAFSSLWAYLITVGGFTPTAVDRRVRLYVEDV
jgi:hypothetical protein